MASRALSFSSSKRIPWEQPLKLPLLHSSSYQQRLIGASKTTTSSDGGSQKQRAKIQCRQQLDNIRVSASKQHQQCATLNKVQQPLYPHPSVSISTFFIKKTTSNREIDIHIGVPAARLTIFMHTNNLSKRRLAASPSRGRAHLSQQRSSNACAAEFQHTPAEAEANSAN
ncbi:hypothetical protein Nepgr_014665 [Nepenthes gracilis]|uniref:Uncharacterized protein n=1 Tax=Nepenthes gracilis TaxID=150966 RepID=A0AAD3XQC5_NEPGR|nr:hypothetical protein Nepgr_014665 [Nepenthes gracilis]